MAHTVGLQEECVIERRHRDSFEVIRPVVIRCPVEIGSSDFFESVDVERLNILAAPEHQVFEKMGESRLPGFLILRANVIPDVYGNDRRLVVLMNQDREAVLKDELLIRNVNIEFLRQRR